ncbi:hypothetical protein AMS68_005829 [Peltaster fructicola]|uniref:Uncharacterized protein n=1 Tax=Peltaster fructicola TaxID=286661 RepID=A0A6H0XZV8_9PEZI|nr:hypothetical protein AMS68_005829 [Peltaster fructicola]
MLSQHRQRAPLNLAEVIGHTLRLLIRAGRKASTNAASPSDFASKAPVDTHINDSSVVSHSFTYLLTILAH